MHPRLAHFGPVVLPTYGVVAAVGLVLAIALAGRCATRMRVNEDAMTNLCIAMGAGTLIFSRLVLIAEAPASFLRYPLFMLALPTVTRFGLLAAGLTGMGYVLWRRMPLLRTLDSVAPPAAMFDGFLHLGDLFAGDDLGVRTSLHIGRLVPGDEGHHPVAIYAAVLSFVIAAFGLVHLRRERQAGQAFGLVLASMAAARFLVDEVRVSYLLPQTYLPGLALRVDQGVLLLLVLCGGLFFLTWGARRAQ